MQAAIIGCGLIGQKRAHALGDVRLALCCDLVESRAAELAARHPDCLATTDWQAAATHPGIDIVIVASAHDMLAPIAAAAAGAGRHVLIEKPGARHGEWMLVRFGFSPADFRNAVTSPLKIESLSKITYLYGAASGNASRNCWTTHSAVGWRDTLK